MTSLRSALPLLLCLGLATVQAEARQGAPPPAAPADLGDHLVLPPIDTDRLLAEDAKTAARGPGPQRFAAAVEILATPWTDGQWQALPDGSMAWYFTVNSPAATDLNFGFRRFRMPEGAALWISAGGKHEGPYTHADNETHGELWTPMVPGDRATITLLVPPNPDFQPELELSQVGHGYLDLLRRLRDPMLPKSGGCNNDVVCPEGDPWRSEIDSVAVYSLGGDTFCTGQMIMDVPQTFRNWFLTANHCGVRANNAASLVVFWNYQASTCGGARDGTLDQNQTGSTFRARSAGPDTCLVELDDDPDPAFSVYYSGWDASEVPPPGTVGIHHPSTDEKAITFNTDPIRPGDSCISGATDSHWIIDQYEDGTTEGGSSGSGLWDADSHLLVGVLSGGGAACSRPDAGDCYGRFGVAWDRGGTPETRLVDWLDPGATGDEMVPGSYASATARYVSHAGADSCALGAGDANDLWAPGEQVALDVTILATGDLTGVSATLSTSTPGVSIPVASATWPDLPARVSTVNDAPGFRVSLDSIACLEEIDFTLTITSNEGGPYVQTFTQEVGLRLAADVPKPIVDNGLTTSDLVVGESFNLNALAVRVQATHSWVGDLRLTLRAPDGREVLLLDGPVDGGGGSCRDDDMDVLFDDASLVDLAMHCDGTTPWFSGDAFPLEPLSPLLGMSVAGTWTLVIEDLANGDGGTVIWWELVTDPPLSSDCTVCVDTPCSGTEISIADLRVSKAPGGELSLDFTGPDSPCATGVQVRLATTPRPAGATGNFPSDPAFADVSGEDLDAGPAFRHAAPAGAAYYLVVENLPDGSPGPSGHYGN